MNIFFIKAIIHKSDNFVWKACNFCFLYIPFTLISFYKSKCFDKY